MAAIFEHLEQHGGQLLFAIIFILEGGYTPSMKLKVFSLSLSFVAYFAVKKPLFYAEIAPNNYDTL